MFGYIYRLIIIPGLITVSYFYGYLLFQEPTSTFVESNIPQNQLKSVSLLLNGSGIPEEVGYMTTPLKLFNEDSLLPWQKLRMKRWDHFDVITDKFILTVSLADAAYLGEVRADFFDFETRVQKGFKKSILPHKIPPMSPTSYRFTGEQKVDDISYDSGDGEVVLKIENIGTIDQPQFNTRRISFTSKELGAQLDLKLRVPLKQEAMVGVIPLAPELQHFFYTVKMPNIVAEGTLKIGSETRQISADKSSGFIDWGRGVWTYNSFWVFVRSQGFLEDGKRRFSLNFASGYADNVTASATEDAFFIDETLYKLNTVYPTYDDHMLKNPWSFTTKNYEEPNAARACEILFAPHYQNEKLFNLYVAKSHMRVSFGEFSGWVSDDKGKKIHFQKLLGMAEVHKAKW